MSEVTPGVTEESPTSPDQTPDPGPEQASVEPTSDIRFQEMTKHKEAAEKEAKDLRAWAQKAQPYVQSLEARLKAAEEVKAVTPGGETPAGEDAAEAYLRDSFGRDEDGQKAYKTFTLAVEHELKKGDYVKRGEAQAMALQGDARVKSQLSSVAEVSNTLSDMSRKGMLNQDGATKLYQRVQAQMNADPQLADRPSDVKHLTRSMYTEMLLSGDLDRPTFQAPTNPLQPSGGSAPKGEEKVDTGTVSSRFGRLKSMDPKVLEAKMKQQEAREGRH